MTRLDQATEIIELAEELGVDDSAPVEGILAFCNRRIDGWVAEAGGVADIDALESLVTQRLQMAFEEIWTDEDWERLKEVYARRKKEFVFGGIRTKFDDDDNPTFGALIELRSAGPNDAVRFVAVIDCRGKKASRRFFTRWHEIAHRMTTHGDGGETKPCYRSEQDPIERLMDEIAGQIGFYDPIFTPAFQSATQGRPHLTFSMVERVVNGAFPRASFQATLIASVRRWTTPLIYLEAAPAYNKEMKRRLATKSLFDDDPPPAQLRAVKVVQNNAAQQERFSIQMNMRVPADSVIHRLFSAESLTDGDGEEDLSQWESKGKSLQARNVVVEARKVLDRVIAIVQPMEAVRIKKREKSQPMF